MISWSKYGDVWKAARQAAAPARPAGIPVVYSPQYNISFWGLEKLHPFDPCKFKKIMRALDEGGALKQAQVFEPSELPIAALHEVHSEEYLQKLHTSSSKVARVIELPPVALLPISLVQRLLLRKMRTHVAGTVLAVALAAEFGCAVNVGGGMHHAHRDDGDGWCPYSDITLAVRRLRQASDGKVRRCMVIDTDAHQGNGHARDKLNSQDGDLFIVDLYNADVYPGDAHARRAIDVDVQLRSGCTGQEYLSKLEAALTQAFDRFEPQMVIHNAGSDILDKDPLGRMAVSAEDMARRDALVFEWCRGRGVPVCMLLSGGYAAHSAAAVATSLQALCSSE